MSHTWLECGATPYTEGSPCHPIITLARRGWGASPKTPRPNEEAIGHLRRALALVGTLSETGERNQRELGLQMAIGVPLTAARGFSRPENEQAYARARELASQVGESPELPRVLVGMAAACLVKGDLATAVAQEAMAAAERTGDAFDLLSAHSEVAFPLFYHGDFSRALQHFEQSIKFYSPSAHGSLAYSVGFDRGVFARAYAAWCHVYELRAAASSACVRPRPSRA